MVGLGTIINAGMIIAGGTIGLLLRKKFDVKYKNILMNSIGLATLIIGISGALQWMFVIVENSHTEQLDYMLDRVFVIEIIGFLVVGSLLGVYLKIEERLNLFAQKMQEKYAKNKGDFAQGFVTASLIFCVGAMAITGSIEDGLNGSITTLFAKSMLDGVMTMILASTFGVGALFSFIPVVIYQGSITIIARLSGDIMVDEVATQMSIVGSILIIGIALEILEIKKVKVANMLPAIFVPIVYYFLLQLIDLIIITLS